MNPGDPPVEGLDAAERLFSEAVELPPEDRRGFLERVCPDDRVLREGVLRLLEADEAAMTADLPSPTVWLPSDSHAVGDVIADRYRLVRRIGTGGLGVVWQAEQIAPVQRKVAIKFIRHDFDGRNVTLRFAMERRALSMMDHPGIATIFDAGVEREGRPYFAMELVSGEPITTACNGARMTIEERVALLAQVCHAVHHAHQKGIVHRDLKPSNILVSTVDGAPKPKIIDFGIAKAIGDEASPEAALTAITRAGQFVGTPAYMAPEQLSGDASRADVRSDVFALGVVLHELLAGCLPHDRSSGAAASPLGQPPSPATSITRPPSTSIRRLPSDDLSRVAAERRETPRSLRHRLRGELDWITGRAMAEEPHRRYASANEMADDLLRWLRHEPIAAGPPGAAYRLRKFVQRHTLATAAGALLALSMALGLAGTTTGLLRARAAEQQQRDLRRTAELATQAEAAQRDTAIAEAEKASLHAYKAQIAAISAAISACDIPTARRLLEATDPGRRGWEWRHLRHLSDQADAVLPVGGTPMSVLLTPDAAEIVVGSMDGSLRRFDAATGAVLGVIDAGLDRCLWLDIAPSGERLIAGFLSLARPAIAEYRLFEWPSGKILAGGGGVVTNRAFSCDGELVAVTDQHAPTATILAARNGEVVRSLALPERASAFRTGFGNEPQTLGLWSSWYGLVGTVDLATESTSQWQVPQSLDGIFDVTSGLYLWTDGKGDAFAIRPGSAESPLPIRRRSPRGTLKELHTSRDGRLLVASTTMDGSIQLHDLAGDRHLALLHGHLSRLLAADVSRDGRLLASIGEDSAVRLWRLPPPSIQFVAPLTDPTARIGAAITRDGRHVTSGGWGTVQCWRSDIGALVWSLDLGSRYIEHLTYSPNEDRLAVAETNGRAVVLSAVDGSLIRSLPSVEAGHTGLAWDPLDRWVVIAGADGTLRRESTESAAVEPRLKLFDGPITALALSRDGVLFAAGAGIPILAKDNWAQLIAVPTAAPELVVGRLADGRILARCPLSQGPSALCFSPDRSRLFIGRNDGSVLAVGPPEDRRPIESADPDSRVVSEESAMLCLPRTDLTSDASSFDAPGVSWHQVSHLSCTRDGSRLLVGKRDGSVSVVMPVEDGLLLTLQADWSVHQATIEDERDSLVIASRTPITVYETSLPPRDVAEWRRRVAEARSLVDPLVTTERILDRVLAKLEQGLDQETSEPALREEARRHAHARGEYRAIMISQAIELARDPAAARERHQTALDWVEHLEADRQAQQVPGPSPLDGLRATLLLRVGRADASAEILERLMASPEDVGDLATAAVAVLVRLHQGRLDDAAELMARIEAAVQAGTPVQGEATWYLPEARRTLEGRLREKKSGDS